MTTVPTYPGVYIQEIPSGVRTITGVSTSIAAFVGYFRRGVLNEPIQLFNLGDFERLVGGLHRLSEASYAVRQFFMNGGKEAWVVRTASGGIAAANTQLFSGAGALALTVEAGRGHSPGQAAGVNPGEWGNNLRVTIDYPTPTSNDRFNMMVALTETRNGEQVIVLSEVFRNLSMDANDGLFVDTVVNDEFSGSQLVRVAASGSDRPAQTGTVSGPLADPLALTAVTGSLNVSIGTEGSGEAILWETAADRPTTIRELRAQLEAAIRAAVPQSRAFSEATVTVVDNSVRVTAGPTQSDGLISFAAAGTDSSVSDLGLNTGMQFQGLLSDDLSGVLPPADASVDVTIGAVGPVTVGFTPGNMNNLADAAAELQTQIQSADASSEFTGARVVAYDDGVEQHLLVLAGVTGQPVTVDGAAATQLLLDAGHANSVQSLVSAELNPVPSISAMSHINVTIGGIGPVLAEIANAASVMGDIANELQAGIRAADPAASFAGAHVGVPSDGENRLVVLPGIAGDTVVFDAAPADPNTVSELNLDTAGGVEVNVQMYALGVAAGVPGSFQGPGVAGNDGDLPDGAAIIGDLNAKSGIFALEDVDLFNILCIPRTAMTSPTDASNLSDAEAFAVMTSAINYCTRRRAFFIMDTPSAIDAVDEVRDWLDDHSTLRVSNAALYFPRVLVPDPLTDFRPRTIGACGTMAGIFAKTDGTRGVWKAPAGTETRLTNVQRLDYALTNAENGALNPLAINCLRTFPVYGNISWGSRTLAGSDQEASEYKYIPVRRLALFMEESLYRGTQWVVFEPNDEPLWSQIRANITAFMHRLFRKGAFQGQKPGDAYLVKCDSETTTQADIDLGIVNILVGFAPLKPAEFVIIQIQQLTKPTAV